MRKGYDGKGLSGDLDKGIRTSISHWRDGGGDGVFVGYSCLLCINVILCTTA